MIKTKATGPIPPGYSAIDGELAIGGQKASALVAENGSPLFVYSSSRLDARMAQLRTAMPDALDLHYAMKANPFPPLLRHMVGLADGIDIASGGELRMALDAGAAAEHISFAGPGKRDDELEQAIRAGVTINIESPSECDRALRIGTNLGTTPRLAIRVNPDFDLKGSGMKMGGGAKPFGMDIELVAPTVKRILDAGADWRGFHIFAGSQALSADAIIETQAQTLELAARLATMVGQAPDHVNLGGGFGIPYFPGDEPVDIEMVGNALSEQFERLPDILASTQFAIELGRYLVGEAGVYLTQIVDRKESQGHIFLVTDGGLHHQLAASGNFGTVVRRNYPAAIASRFEEEPSETVSIVGCLCTPLDRLSDNAAMPEAHVGDIVAIFCAGAYGASASPANFLGQGPAKEILVD
ncbi:pyridoxal-dependent decarboxylase, exosortase A system-associated [Parasphingorhabdus flavimaris]|jgi:diaminopimelate decarboxylase|uniref:Pyridoxal-dependent decarboxylase, exosortase A system-associated n=1 Tax=Parasphingorhabdus flavimaris TaxID=266812 RepID=A0ABX2N1V3_9SPHN|nr:pyridoxal-dependent decarboxylase, exosortase A system-associated [Parasphingorhabdus flavimaris]NVD27664.1 pyridoxal-dependent decarboxylase, exosortase A system-associated [Parasphingorhabdus flavimaris]|tara:strand:- start:29126 stop:30361 length:1236 start_codon:yes stop_codon:yes gene_type:complete